MLALHLHRFKNSVLRSMQTGLIGEIFVKVSGVSGQLRKKILAAFGVRILSGVKWEYLGFTLYFARFWRNIPKTIEH